MNNVTLCNITVKQLHEEFESYNWKARFVVLLLFLMCIPARIIREKDEMKAILLGIVVFITLVAYLDSVLNMVETISIIVTSYAAILLSRVLEYFLGRREDKIIDAFAEAMVLNGEQTIEEAKATANIIKSGTLK